MLFSLKELTNIATIIGVIVSLTALGFLIRQIQDSTKSRYIDILLHSNEEYATDEMLKAVRLVRETTIDRYKEILSNGSFTDAEWSARRKVSAYWQVMAILVRKKYVDIDTFFGLTQSTVTIYKKLRDIRALPNPHYTVDDLDDIEWLYHSWEKWAIKMSKKLKKKVKNSQRHNTNLSKSKTKLFSSAWFKNKFYKNSEYKIKDRFSRWFYLLMKKRIASLIKICFIEFWDIAIIVIAIIVILYLTILKVIDVSKFISTFVGLFTVLIMAIIKTYKNRQQLMIINLATNYIMKKNGANIDELLGILIGGVWRKKKSEPVDMFFNCLNNICLGDDSELKRRITESLPALFLINRKESKRLIEILRYDLDDRWKSDNRRRTIEALPFLMMKEKEFVKETLKIDYDDEIYTLIAIVEVIDEWKRKINKEEAEKIFKDLIDQMVEYGHNSEDMNTLNKEWSLLELTYTNTIAAKKKFDEILTDKTDLYMLVCIARELPNLCSYYPKCKVSGVCKGTPHEILKYINLFLMKENHRNIRRPMAKETILDCLIVLLKRKGFIDEAKETIWNLIKDEDSIIRRPAFDKVDKICDIDYEFGKSIIEYVSKQNDDTILSVRGKVLNRSLDIM